MPNNLIRVKQLDQNELSGFVGQSIVNTGLLNDYFVSRVGDQTISGIKTFTNNLQASGTGIFNALVANNLQASGTGIFNALVANNLQAGSGIFNALDLNNIDNLSISGVDINISGHVGIGINNNQFGLYVRKSAAGVTVNPDSNSIAVFEGSGNSHITVLASDGQTAGVVLGSPADNFGSYLSWNYDNSALKLATAKTSGFIQILTNNENEAVRITRSGDVGVGMTSPSEKLEVFGNIKASGASFTKHLTVNNTGVLLTGQNIFVLQGGTTEATTTAADTNYIGLAGGNIGYSNSSTSRRVPILENCVARKASIILLQGGAGTSTSNITGSIVNLTQGLTGIISQSMSSTNNSNFISFSNSNLNVPFSAGDNAAAFIHCPSAIANLRTLVNVYFYN